MPKCGPVAKTKAAAKKKPIKPEDPANNLKDTVSEYRRLSLDYQRLLKTSAEEPENWTKKIGYLEDVGLIISTTSQMLECLCEETIEFLRDFELAMGNPKSFNNLKNLLGGASKLEELEKVFAGQTENLKKGMATLNRVKQAEEGSQSESAAKRRKTK